MFGIDHRVINRERGSDRNGSSFAWPQDNPRFRTDRPRAEFVWLRPTFVRVIDAARMLGEVERLAERVAPRLLTRKRHLLDLDPKLARIVADRLLSERVGD